MHHHHVTTTKEQRAVFALVFFGQTPISQVAALTSVDDIARVLGSRRIASARIEPGAEIHVAADSLLGESLQCVELTSGRLYGIKSAVVTRPIRSGLFGTLSPDLVQRVRARVRTCTPDDATKLTRAQADARDDWRTWTL